MVGLCFVYVLACCFGFWYLVIVGGFIVGWLFVDFVVWGCCWLLVLWGFDFDCWFGYLRVLWFELVMFGCL